MLGVWAFLSGLSTGFFGEIVPESQAPSTLALFFAIVLANILVLEWYIIRSKIYGQKLFLVLLIEIFGVNFFMPQIETLVFNESIGMPMTLVIALILSGLIVALVVSRLAVRVFKKQEPDFSLKLNEIFGDKMNSKLARSFIALALVYTALYMLFGYFVAWQFVGLREYYSGSTELLSFVEQWLATLNTNPIALPLQFFRGLLWAGLAFIAIKTMESEITWEKPIIVGLLMSVGLSLPILLPQAYMPAVVRYGHFPELLLENFIFGVIATLIFDNKQ